MQKAKKFLAIIFMCMLPLMFSCGGGGGGGGGGPTLVSIAVTPANPSITVGATQQFAAIGTYSDSTTQDITTQVTWASSTTAIATINSSGLATAVSAGTTTITATLGSISGNVILTVTTTRNYVGTQSPGDFWTWTITTDANGTGTFSGKNETMNKTYSGNISKLSGNSSGFSKATVTTTTDTNLTPPVDAYVIEIPDTALVAAPAPFKTLDHSLPGEEPSTLQGTNNPPIVGLAKGSCPTGIVNTIWMVMPGKDWCSRPSDPEHPTSRTCTSADNAYGTAMLTENNGVYTVDVSQWILDGSNGDPFTLQLTNGTCSDGVISFVSGTDTTRISLAPSGVFIVDSPETSVVGFVRPDSDIDLTDVLANGRQFRGMYFNSWYGYNACSTDSDCTGGGTCVSGTCAGPETDPVYATADGTKIIGTYYTNIDNGTLASWSVPITFNDSTQDVPGLIRAKLTDADGTHDIILLVRKINEKYFAFMICDNWWSMHGHNVFVIEP